ncbi:sulfotransferase family protein [Pilimelia terevasa]|uniref:Sulfotransferase family protein n=1 Tax=Pilimelia terevasa TaxID=53372 RepID=A0A8J3BIZ5_9ACTN|nr:sulfotransferase [Pilimelia terevasa]GGK24586.1 sulfotransferase family protein [Pilimelia terevasa]
MVKVLYIAGWGRSGTTILDNILNAYPSVFSAGELFYLWRRGLVQGRRCGCGVRLPDCPCWSAIRRQAFGTAEPDPREMMALQAEAARARHALRLYHRPHEPAVRRYREIMGQVYRAVGEVTGAELVVDSSKTPAGAAVLARLAGVEGYLVHMVRDPRAVAYSWMRAKPQVDRPRPAMMDRHGPWESTGQWLACNAVIAHLAPAYGPRQARLRYEDFLTDPRARVENLLRLAGVSTADGPFRGPREVALVPNHTVSGNPSRFTTGTVTLRLDDAWRGGQRPRDRVVASAVALPLLRRYGYPLQPRRPPAAGPRPR